jgi:hypothetical protein
MDYEIIRAETVPDREGRDEVFVQIQYSDRATGKIVHYAKWLTSAEQEKYKEDKAFLESDLIPKWEPFAIAQHEEAKAAEEASKLTMEKAIAALVDTGAMSKATAGKFSKAQVATLETAAKEISQAKVDAVVVA